MESKVEGGADPSAVFMQHRPLMFSLAYRMMGSVSDAEDIVQDAFLRWHRASENKEGPPVESPKSYLSTTVTRLCIDRLRSAQAQREVYSGIWLPEPLVEGDEDPVAERAELDDMLSFAVMVLLESLAPEERAVFLLRQVFGYEYSEIARIVNKSEAACRQIVRRAGQRVAERRPRFEVSQEQHAQVMQQFMSVCLSGDMNGLLAMLSKDVVARSDGGGKQRAALNPIYGPEKVARFLFGILNRAAQDEMARDFTVRPTLVNGRPGIVAYIGKSVYGVSVIDIGPEGIRAVDFVVNPDKLAHIPPLE